MTPCDLAEKSTVNKPPGVDLEGVQQYSRNTTLTVLFGLPIKGGKLEVKRGCKKGMGEIPAPRKIRTTVWKPLFTDPHEKARI